jgi:hypothetical protein
MLENLRQAPDGPADRELLKRWTVKTREVWGVRLERDTAHVWTLADRKVTKCQVYLDRAEALEVLGLKE